MNAVTRVTLLAVAACGFLQPVATQAQTTLGYTGSTQTDTVPTGVESIRIKVWGAGGGSAANITGSYGAGAGAGFVQADIAVKPGQQITVVVGQGGAGWSSTEGYAGATYPNGGTAVNYGGGGGGRTEVTGVNFDLLASGGGGGGYYFNGDPAKADMAGRQPVAPAALPQTMPVVKAARRLGVAAEDMATHLLATRVLRRRVETPMEPIPQAEPAETVSTAEERVEVVSLE